MDDCERSLLFFDELEATVVTCLRLNRVLYPHRLEFLVEANLVAWDHQGRHRMVVRRLWSCSLLLKSGSPALEVPRESSVITTPL